MISQKLSLARRVERDRALQRYRRDRARNQLSAQPGVHEFALVLDNLKAGFNVAKIFRSAEVFGTREVHLINIGPFDPAPSVGAFRKVPTRFFDTFETSYVDLTRRGYTLFMLDPRCKRSLLDVQLPSMSAFIFGHEEHGLSFAPSLYPSIHGLGIPQFGRTDSLNVSIAASIVMYECVRQRYAP